MTDATRFDINSEALDALPLDKRRKAISALADLAGGHRRNPLYRFDPLDPNGTGIPHMPQHRFLSSHTSPEGKSTKWRLFIGGNRSGKTTAGVVADIIDCCDREAIPAHLQQYKRWEPPVSMFFVGISEKILESIHFPVFRMWCPKDQLVGNSFDKALNGKFNILHFKNGSRIQFMTQGMDEDAFQGAALHRVHFDEEPLYDHGKAIYGECAQRLVDYNGDTLLTFTPLNGMTWIYDKFYVPWSQQQPDREAADEGWAGIESDDGKLSFPLYLTTVSQDDNPTVSEEGKAAAMLAAATEEEKKARKYGRFVSFAGRIFDDFSRSRHVVPDDEIRERYAKPDLQQFLGCLDPGFRHQAAALWLGLDEDGVWVFPELVLARTVIPDVAAQIEKTRTALGLRPAIFISDPAIARIDPQTGRTDQDAYARAGLRTRAGNNDVRASINAIRNLLAGGRLHIGASCDELIDQLLRYRWRTAGRSEDASPERPVKRDDHCVDALRYGVMSLPIPEVAPEQDTRSALRRAADADIQRAMEARVDLAHTTIGAGQFE